MELLHGPSIYDNPETVDEVALNRTSKGHKVGFPRRRAARRNLPTSHRPPEFNTFRQLFRQLPPTIEARWQTTLRAYRAIEQQIYAAARTSGGAVLASRKDRSWRLGKV